MRPAFQKESYDKIGRQAEERFADYLRSHGFQFIWSNEKEESGGVDFQVTFPYKCAFEVEHKHPKYFSTFGSGIDFIAEKVDKYSGIRVVPIYYVLEMDTCFVFAGMQTIKTFGEKITKDTSRRKDDQFYRLSEDYAHMVNYTPPA